MRGGSNPPRTSKRNRTAGLSLRKQGCSITATGMPTRTTAGRGRNGSRRCPVQPGRFAAGCSSQVAEPAHARKVESSNLSPATNLGVAPDAWRFHQLSSWHTGRAPQSPPSSFGERRRRVAAPDLARSRAPEEVRGFFFPVPSRTTRKNFRSATAGSGAHCGKRGKNLQIPLACASPCNYIADRRRTSAPAAREERRPCRTELDLHPLAMGLLRPSRPRSPPVPIARGSSRTELRRTPLTPKYAAGKVPDAA